MLSMRLVASWLVKHSPTRYQPWIRRLVQSLIELAAAGAALTTAGARAKALSMSDRIDMLNKLFGEYARGMLVVTWGGFVLEFVKSSTTVESSRNMFERRTHPMGK